MALVEVAAGVYVLRYPVLDVNTTLIVGDEVAAVVDTLSTDAQARELLDEIRRVTHLPLVLINTHHHFDHCFGNRVLAEASPGCAIWAHEATAMTLREDGHRWQRAWCDEYRETMPEFAQELGQVSMRPPDRTVHTESTMDIGGRTLLLRHLGRGHTDGDLVVIVSDTSTVVAGDLVEEGAAPSFEDSYPIAWPDTVAALLNHITAQTTVIPGHGALVDHQFVQEQHSQLTELAWLIRAGHADGAPPEAVAAKAPFDPDAALVAATRGYAELAGRI